MEPQEKHSFEKKTTHTSNHVSSNVIINILKEYIQLQVTNTQGLPHRRKVLLLTWKEWVKAASVQCSTETNSRVVLFDGTIVDVMVNQ